MSKDNRVSDERLAYMLDRQNAGFTSLTSAEFVSILTELQSLRSKPLAGVEVKPLAWHGPDVNGDIHARSILAVYTIRKQQGSLGYWLTEVGGYHSTIEKAKVAAEADYRQRILSTLSLPAQDPAEARVLYRHQKRGTVYELVGIGKMQAENWEEREYTATDEPTAGASVDMREVAVYRSADNPDEIWVRPREEFQDGRFDKVDSSNG